MKRRPTSYDVARVANVSRTTVSLVLNNVPDTHINEATRKRVIDAAIQLNYTPDITGRRLASGKSFNFGLVLRLNPDQVYADAFLLNILLGIEQAARQVDFHVLFKPLNIDDLSGYSQLILGRHVDGIIVAGPRQDDTEIIDIYEQGFPIMMIGQLPGTDVPFVAVDELEGAKIATQHLIEQGYSDIGMITNAPLEYTSAQLRLAGYQKALRNAGIIPDKSLIGIGSYTPTSGYCAMSKLLSHSPNLSAVFVASDAVAFGAIQAAKEAGFSIPEDFAIVGFNDVPLAEYYDPPLSTVRLPAFELGQAAAERLSKLVAGETLDPSGFLLNTELIVRNSSIKTSLRQED
ncbi:MAG: LacI family DNA-binding transcriptional regulator [Anaerolineales bacterium]